MKDIKIATLISLALIGLLTTSSFAAEDIATFWKSTRERLSNEPMEARADPVTAAVPYQQFKVTLRSLDGVHFKSLLALPVQGEAPAKPWPVIVTTPGFGGSQQGVMLSECQRGYAILQVFPRGLGESAELWKWDDSNQLIWGIDKPDGAYYRGAYADVVRAIDFAVSRKDLDPDRIALVGTSQGGGISLAVAAIDPRVKAVVAHLPFLCNFPLAAQAPGSLVKRLLDDAGRNNEASLRTLKYFDPYELAPQLRVNVLMSAGGKDTVCPANTIESVYQRLAGPKSLKFYPELSHTSCVEFYNLSWSWLDLNFRKQTQ